MNRTRGSLAALALLAVVACGGSGSGTDAVSPDTGDVPAVDVPVDVAPDALPEVAPDAVPETVEDAVPDAVPDVVPDADAVEPVDVPDAKELPELVLKAPMPTPADPLQGTGIESCSVYQDQRCSGGKQQACRVYDPAAKQFVANPDPVLHRVLLFERWRDLYMKPDGMTSERNFQAATPPGTPESEWGKPEHFRDHGGMGDSGIWTGWTVVGDILRYGQTGTEADYQRMEQGVRTLLSMYDVSGVPGYFIRYFFLLLPDGTPNDPNHLFRYESQINLANHHYRDVDPAALANLPAVYRDGTPGPDGKLVKGRAMWQGRPSIDQNTGPMNALPMAYPMLRDDTLKQRIAHHLTCYLNRLQRIEIIRLQENPALLDSLMQYFNAGGNLNFDPGDIDLLKSEKIVAYVQRQINVTNEATFDRSCPAGPQLEPVQVIDATSETFLADFLELTFDMDTNDKRETQIDHYYFPTIRGGDAVHLMHLAAMAYWMTGDEQYRRFLFDELIGNMKAIEVMYTTGAFDESKYCSHFFGDQLTYGSWWVFLQMLGDSPLKTDLQKAFNDEMYEKLLAQKGNADFYLMWAGEVPDALAPAKQTALAWALEQLKTMGGNGWAGGLPVVDDPRRSYTLTADFVLDKAPEEIEAVCPTDAEFKSCTTEIDFMGMKIPGQNMIHYQECDAGNPYLCTLPNGKCALKMTNKPLPVQLRQYTDWLWQRNPFELFKGVGLEGGSQMPGADLSEPYWNARRYGFITEGKGQVLAWETTGDCR